MEKSEGVVSLNSQKTIIEKLNLQKYPRKLILHAPADINDFKEITYDYTIKQSKYDLIFIFIFRIEEFSENLQIIIDNGLIGDKGYVFFAYPKKNNPQYQEYIDRDHFFNVLPIDDEGFVLDSSLKFSRMVSLNDVFTVVGLKSVPKKTKRAPNTKASQCVGDYIEHVEDIKQYLNKKEELLNEFNQLTFGYQKDWARYIFSAKRKETQEKRLLEMETVLGDGYKSIELYRRSKRS